MKTLFSFVLILCSIGGYSQINYGVRVGVGFSSLTDYKNEEPNISSIGPRTRFGKQFSAELAVFSEVSFNKRIALIVETELSKRGGTVESEGAVDIYYIGIPAMISINFLQKFEALVGVQYSRIIKNAESANTVSYSELKKNDFSLLFGTLYRINKQIKIQVKYLHGLTDLSSVGFGNTKYHFAQNTALIASIKVYLNN